MCYPTALMPKKKKTVRGSAGGKERDRVLSPERKREIARMGGQKTWANIKKLKERLAEVLAS